MTLPTIHLNGTSPESLLEGYRTAMDAVCAARDALTFTVPNARDYYPQGPDAWRVARSEHDARQRKLSEVYVELETLAVHCSDFICERDARRQAREKRLIPTAQLNTDRGADAPSKGGAA